MKHIESAVFAVLVLVGAMFTACSNDDLEDSSPTVKDNEIVDFVATFTPAQQQNLEKTGSVFLDTQQKDAWHDVIDTDILSPHIHEVFRS